MDRHEIKRRIRTGEPTPACPSGVVLERGVMPEDADADLVRIARLN